MYYVKYVSLILKHNEYLMNVIYGKVECQGGMSHVWIWENVELFFPGRWNLIPYDILNLGKQQK